MADFIHKGQAGCVPGRVPASLLKDPELGYRDA